jgi:hypothetical protein
LPRLEPLAVGIDQRDRAYRRAADASCDAQKIVLRLFRQSVEDLETAQRSQARFFVFGFLRSDHAGAERSDAMTRNDAIAAVRNGLEIIDPAADPAPRTAGSKCLFRNSRRRPP